MFHLRLTHPVIPEIVFSIFDDIHILVSHQQETFHYHLIGNSNLSEKTIRNKLSDLGKVLDKRGNMLYQLKTCDEGMYYYVFHPGSNFILIQTKFSDEEINSFKDKSIERYNEVKSGSSDKLSFQQQIDLLVQRDMCDKLSREEIRFGDLYDGNMFYDFICRRVQRLLRDQNRSLHLAQLRDYTMTAMQNYWRDNNYYSADQSDDELENFICEISKPPGLKKST